MNFDFLGGDKAQLLLAGALGGIVRWMTLRDHWTDGLISMVVGALSAMYLAPAAVPALIPWFGKISVAPENVGPLSGFLLGIGGITISGLIIDAWRLYRRFIRQNKQAAEDAGGGKTP
jgi:hypothetical protein